MQVILSAAASLLAGWEALRRRGRREASEWFTWLSYSVYGYAALWMCAFGIYFLLVIPAHEHERNKLQGTRLYDLNGKLSKAEDRVNALSDALLISHGVKVDLDEWPPLTDAQINSWYAELLPYHFRSMRIFFYADVNARRLLQSIRALGVKLKCEVGFGSGGVDSPGRIYIRPSDQSSGTELVKLFSQLGPSEIQRSDATNLPNENISPSADIFIGERIATPP